MIVCHCGFFIVNYYFFVLTSNLSDRIEPDKGISSPFFTTLDAFKKKIFHAENRNSPKYRNRSHYVSIDLFTDWYKAIFFCQLLYFLIGWSYHFLSLYFTDG